jgi:dTDP-4-amino-4,6-dideoxygalactose transaminase
VKLKVGRGEIFRALRGENIGVNVHYIPVHLHSYYRGQFGYKGAIPGCGRGIRAIDQPAHVPWDDG